MSSTLQEINSGKYKQSKKIKLNCGLDSLPPAILQCEALEILDLSGNNLSQLPDGLTALTQLKILFLSDNAFETFPRILGKMPALEMIAFKNNGMTDIPEDSLCPTLRWLILTNNKLTHLPRSIGDCSRMQKLMLAGNELTNLPDEMSLLANLELLRLSVNKLTTLPSWLFQLPRLSFLAFSGNPLHGMIAIKHDMRQVPWSDLDMAQVLGEGASGTISKATWKSEKQEVAIKLFKGQITSDGAPIDEMNACIKAGSHPNIIDTIAKVSEHPEDREALVLQLIPPTYTILGQPPSFASCTRDNFSPDFSLQWNVALSILRSVADAARHLHGNGILHGDLYAHNTLVNAQGHALLGDFGAATCYGLQHPAAKAIQQIEVRAFGLLIDDLLGLCREPEAAVDQKAILGDLRDECIQKSVEQRPLFEAICESLAKLSC